MYGALSSSGFGDGSYPVEVGFDATGLAVEARVVFMDEEEPDDGE
jgi:hypothetical protein